MKHYAALFANQPARRHFAAYLTGLLIAERQMVSRINRECAVTTDPSCLNRWITEVAWDAPLRNQRRLDRLQPDSATQSTPHGLIAIATTLLAHDGKLIEAAGRFWDHADQRPLIAHAELIANDVGASGKHDPLECRRCRTQDTGSAEATPCTNHPVRCTELVDGMVDQAIPGDVTFEVPAPTPRSATIAPARTAPRSAM